MLTLHEFEKTNELMIAAHRGSSASSTENTLAAFAEAIEAGIQIIELDIQFTADNKIVVYHDFYPPGFEKRISELNYEDIKDIKLCDCISPVHDSVHIPLLEDVIKLVKGKCYLMIEIKVNTGIKFLENVDNIINLILENNYEHNTIFGSFNYSVLKKLKEVNPKIYTGAIKIPGDTRLPSELCKELGTDAFICSVEEMNREIEKDTLENKIFSGIYNVDDDESLAQIMKFKVRAIATNYPEKIIKLLKEKY
jgi:glycerophosphoryl diester phosphodiesterase